MGRNVKKLLAILIITAAILAVMTSCTFLEELSNGLSIDIDEGNETDIPGENDDIGGDNTPSSPETPSKPETPSEPSEPEEPSEPSDPEAPSEPETPSEPSEPETPSEPEEPKEPNTSVLVTVSKTAEELASIKGSTNNATIMSGMVFNLDANVTVEFSQGSAGTPPTYYDPAIRIYQGGGIVTIKAINGRTLDTIVITTDEKSGGSSLSVTGGSSPTKNNGVLTIKANSNVVTIKTGGSTSSTRLYVAEIEVTYLGEEGDGEANTPTTPDIPDEPITPDEPDEPEETTYTFNDFTSAEKTAYRQTIGFVIPFLPNNDYFTESYDEDGYKGVYFSALCEESSRFNAYKALFSTYTSDGTWVDDYGDTWYLYIKGDVYVDICYYESEGSYYLDVDAYVESNSSSGSGSDEDDSDVGGGSSNVDLITNAGAGLPSGENGVFAVDFTKADKVKNVTDQGYYLEGCPTTGNPGVLVIPVEFSDVTAASKGYTTDKIANAFEKDGVNDYYSVYDYYLKSSYDELKLDITVLDEWFRPSKPSTYYASQTSTYEGQEDLIGDQMVMNEALAYLEDRMDLSSFDSDDNGTIDAVVMITTLKIDSDETFYWAYRYWNSYVDSSDNYYEYDGVSANDYLWASYQFLYESYSSSGDTSFNDSSAMNTYTFIHEFGHVLGADDYYDTAGINSPLGSYDIMDSASGDHNAYSKFNYGWITSSRLVVTDSSVTLSLKDFSEHGDTIILASNWKESLGAYQEYYVLSYYTNKGLNAGDDFGYFSEEGIIVHKVNASLFKEDYEGDTYYDVYNNNTDPSDEYGTEDNLIEYVLNANGDYVYGVGDTLNESSLPYTFTVDTLTDGTATITFTKK